MVSDPSVGRPPPPDPDASKAEPPPPYVPLLDTLARTVSRPPSRWRRWLPAVPGRRRALFPALAALATVLVLSLLGIAAPWNSNPTPARGEGLLDHTPVLLDPVPSPVPPPSITARSEAGRDSSQSTGGSGSGDTPCQPPLSVVAAPAIASLVAELAGSLATGSCPLVEVGAQRPAATVATLADGGDAPDVWIPESSLSLRLATAGSGRELPTSGTSIARTPVVLAVPEPVADRLADEGVWPVWLVFYDKVTSGDIPRMSMADLNTTVGALTRVAFAVAADHHWGDDAEGATFLHTVHFRDKLAATDADPAALLDRLATTSPAQSATQVGVFPATEQQLLAYRERNPATAAVPFGTYEAMSEADYPMAMSGGLDDRLAGIADELRAQLRSPAAVKRLVEEGFRPPRGDSTRPAALADTDRFPDYPEPVPLPDRDRWNSIVEGWTWTG